MTSWLVAGTSAGVLALASAVLPAHHAKGRAFFSRPTYDLGGLEVAYALELIALALEGGAPASGALMAVAESSARPGIRDVLNKVGAGLQWGLDAHQSWAVAPAAWAPAARAFVLSGRAGTAPAKLLRTAAADVRHAESERISRGGAAAGVYIVLPLGLCFLPAFLLITVVPLVLGLIQMP